MASAKVCALVFSVLCFASLIESNNALKCYQCSSLTDPKCADLKNSNIQPVECFAVDGLLKPLGFGDLPKQTCQKLVFSNNTVTRGCLFKDACDTIKGLNTQVTFCGSCEKDGCNGATSQQLWLPILIVTPIIFAVKAIL